MSSRIKVPSFSPSIKRVLIISPLFFGTFLFGMFGLHLTEGKPLFESFFLTVTTVSTVGYGDGMTSAGRMVVIIVILCSMTIVAYTFGTVLRAIIEGELSQSLGRHKLEKAVSSLNNHYIVCGYGRIGKLIAKELSENRIPYVVIDNAPDAGEKLAREHTLFLTGDATTEEVLSEAGIMRAKGLVTAVKSDADNVFITLTARSLNPSLFILSRGTDEKDELKLKRAGATKVVLPYIIGGKRMAQAIIRPAVTDFIDAAMAGSGLDLSMEELQISKKGFATGKNLIESNIRRVYGIIIVAIKREGKGMIFNPVPQEVLTEGDVLVVLGTKDDLRTLKKKL